MQLPSCLHQLTGSTIATHTYELIIKNFRNSRSLNLMANSIILNSSLARHVVHDDTMIYDDDSNDKWLVNIACVCLFVGLYSQQFANKIDDTRKEEMKKERRRFTSQSILSVFIDTESLLVKCSLREIY